MSNFTWLLNYFDTWLSIILRDLYFFQVQFKLTICTFTWLHFWRKNSTFYSLQFYFISKSTLNFYFILCTLNMVNGSSNVCDWHENQWSLFSCIKHTHFYFSYDFHQVNVWLQNFTIKSEEAYWGSNRGPFKVRQVPPQIFEPSRFGMQLPKDKNSRLIFSIFDTITPAWLNHSVCLSSAAELKSVFAETDTDVFFIALRIITNHTRFCWSLWMQWPIRGVQMSHRWNSGVSSLARWLNTSFWRILSSETTKCKCVYESVRY